MSVYLSQHQTGPGQTTVGCQVCTVQDLSLVRRHRAVLQNAACQEGTGLHELIQCSTDDPGPGLNVDEWIWGILRPRGRRQLIVPPLGSS